MSIQPYQLRGSRVLITGGARRVGLAITHRLAQAGAAVVVHVNQSLSAAEEVVQQLRDAGMQADSIQADLSEQSDTTRLVREIGAEGSFPVDAIVHAASPFDRIPLRDLTPDELNRYYGVHLRAPVFLAQSLFAQMQSRNSQGRIVHITDASLKRPYGGYSAYFATKQALDGLTRALAVELAPFVLINNVAPGTVLPPEDATPGYARALADKSPLKTTGTPDDVARAVEFLLTDPGFITGSTITVDGGACMS